FSRLPDKTRSARNMMHAGQALPSLGLIILFTAIPSPVLAWEKPAQPLTAEQAREELAYTVGVQAYVYGYPLVELYRVRYARVFVGKRTTGTKAGNFAIVGPGWKGTLPEGMQRIDAPTNAVWLLGRILVDGKDDLAAVHALQDRCTLAPLSDWDKARSGPPRPL